MFPYQEWKSDMFEQIAKDAKATYKIGRIVLVNTEIVEEYLENFREY